MGLSRLTQHLVGALRLKQHPVRLAFSLPAAGYVYGPTALQSDDVVGLEAVGESFTVG